MARPSRIRFPTRAPDLVHECDTRADQAFIYALSGDRNPLHRDPKSRRWPASRGRSCTGCAPMARPAARSSRRCANTIAKKITGFDVRFSSPVFPGETIVTEMWVDGNVVSFRCKLKERDVVVINNGKCTIAA